MKKGSASKNLSVPAGRRGKAQTQQSVTSDKDKLKEERARIREEKKAERERKLLLKKVEPNPDVEEITVNPILETVPGKKVPEFPLEGCSKFSDNRKFLFLYAQGKKDKKARQELIKLISKDSSLSNPFQAYSTGTKKSVLNLAVEDGDLELVKILLKEQKRINEGESKRPHLPVSSLAKIGTGTFNRYQFGFKTRNVSLSRGGKEGNNALTNDNYLGHQDPFPSNLTAKTLHTFLMHNHMSEGTVLNCLWEYIRKGDIDFLKAKTDKKGTTFMQKCFDNYGYGFNRYHYQALDDDIEGRINKLSMIKKPHTNRSICPLHVACINPNITVLRKYYMANPEYSAADLDQRKLMHYAAANKTDAALNFLISKGVPANDKDIRGTTPLMIACELGRTDNVICLLNEQKKQLEDLDPNDEDYWLMKQSSNFANSYGPYHTFPLHYAVESGNEETVKALIENAGEDIDIEVRNKDGLSPIAIACSKGYYEIAEFLLEKGAKVHETKKKKKNPLIWAAQNGHIHIVSLLLRHGIHPDVPDSSGNTATHYAAGYGWLNVLKFLVENGAHPDLKNDWNSTPAMIAMLKNHFGCLDFLMELDNVDKSMVDNEGRSVISQLCMSFTNDTLEQIKYMDKFEHLDYTLKDANGWTCMHFLVSNQVEYNEITNKVNTILKKQKADLMKKNGKKGKKDDDMDVDASEEEEEPVRYSKSASRSKSRRKPAAKMRATKKKFGVKAARMALPTTFGALPKMSGFGGLPTLATSSLFTGGTQGNLFQNSGTLASPDDEININNFEVYYNNSNVKHRELYR